MRKPFSSHLFYYVKKRPILQSYKYSKKMTFLPNGGISKIKKKCGVWRYDE